MLGATGTGENGRIADGANAEAPNDAGPSIDLVPTVDGTTVSGRGDDGRDRAWELF